jgi:D-psicose/D-tagatose/L-ribulose 3-epimerase
MTLAVSNIAWPADEELAVAARLAQLGVRAVEIAPTRVFTDPLHVPDHELIAYLAFWADHGAKVIAFQSMLFGRMDLTLFDDAATRRATRDHLVRFLELAGRMGVEVLVFGSPKNRRVPDGIPAEEAFAIARDFFADLGEIALQNGTCLCIEPNPPAYDCTFVTTAVQGRELVDAVNHPGFGLHLDAAGMTLAGDDIAAAITAARALRHFHVSAPHLGAIEDKVVDHDAAAGALASIGYDRHVSIEMRPGEFGEAPARVEAAVTLARRHYGALTT